jgi:hypothetical protein
MKKKILFVGCSFTADSGFDNNNLIKYHWPSLVSEHFDCYYYNAGIRGSSNEEIFYRTIEITANQSFDLVVIMWSNLGRKWAYFSAPNVDNFTIINPGPFGLNANSTEVESFHKLYVSYFNNEYVALKQWLDQIICLQGYFKHKKQLYVFLKGFDNLICDFDNVRMSVHGFEHMSDSVKRILNFDNNPDHYIFNKIEHIQQLIHQVDTDNWIDFKNFSFFKSQVDLADDLIHPGKLSNQTVSLQLIAHINANKLLG